MNSKYPDFPLFEDLTPYAISKHFTHDQGVKIWWERFVNHFPNDAGNVSRIEFYQDDPNGEGEDVIIHYNNGNKLNFHINKASGYAELGHIRK